jgi:pyruvate formate lyase activating enzyme
MDQQEHGLIWDVKRYALHDGPGIRTTVFFMGCPLSCLWCCNPESQSVSPRIGWIGERCLACDLCLKVCPRSAVMVDDAGVRRVDPSACDVCGRCAEACPGEAWQVWGRYLTVGQVLSEVNKDAVFYARSGGGMTLSGGEPLFQADFARDLLYAYKRQGGLTTAVETCGAVAWEKLAAVVPYTDRFLYDVKHLDAEAHQRLTGAGNRLILDNLEKLAASAARVVIRLPLIPECNDSEENVARTAELAKNLGVSRLDLLPYHRLGEPKYARFGLRYPLAGTPTPPRSRAESLARLAEGVSGLDVRIGG